MQRVYEAWNDTKEHLGVVSFPDMYTIWVGVGVMSEREKSIQEIV